MKGGETDSEVERMKQEHRIPFLDPTAPLDKSILAADPLGSYTGRPKDPLDTPVQDADDL